MGLLSSALSFGFAEGAVTGDSLFILLTAELSVAKRNRSYASCHNWRTDRSIKISAGVSKSGITMVNRYVEFSVSCQLITSFIVDQVVSSF